MVPVIAKADTLTTQEVKKLKERILADIEEHEIQVNTGNIINLYVGMCVWYPLLNTVNSEHRILSILKTIKK